MQFHVKNQHRRQDSVANFKVIFLCRLVQHTCPVPLPSTCRLPALVLQPLTLRLLPSSSSWAAVPESPLGFCCHCSRNSSSSSRSRQKCQSRGRKKTNFSLLPVPPSPVLSPAFTPFTPLILDRSTRRLLPLLSVKQRTQTEIHSHTHCDESRAAAGCSRA